MACLEVRNIPNPNRNDSICDLLRKIDQIQKEAIIANASSACDSCMISTMFNTKPIAIFLCDERFVAHTPSGEAAKLFRIEDVRGCETVVLRLLVTDPNCEVVCTNYTVVVKIACICAVQCFEPMNCETHCFPMV